VMAFKRLETLMRRKDIDACLFLSLENIRYLCGFTGRHGALVIAGGGRTFLSDSRYEQQAKEEIRAAGFKKYKRKIEGLAQFLGSLRIKRLGFESSAMTCESYQQLKEKLPRLRFVPLAGEIRDLRARKEPEELGKIREAIRIAPASFTAALPRIKPGGRERDVADFLEYRMKRRGGGKRG